MYISFIHLGVIAKVMLDIKIIIHMNGERINGENFDKRFSLLYESIAIFFLTRNYPSQKFLGSICEPTLIQSFKI